jgi:hypothetical protein
VFVATLAGVGLFACTRATGSPRANSLEKAAAGGAGLVLQVDEGERRVRRNVGKGRLPAVIR